MIKILTSLLIMISLSKCAKVTVPFFISMEESFYKLAKKWLSPFIKTDSPSAMAQSSSPSSTLTNAMGFQYDSGPAFAILCKGTPYGTVPGKLDGAGGAYYPWGWQEHKCESWEQVHGILYSNKVSLPENCEPKGFQTNDNNKYYNAVVQSDKGLIPGKASQDLKFAWYSWGGKETPVTDNFYVIC